jgi:hypothetical protein
VLQGRAVEELHDDVGAALFLADVVDGANVGMIQRGRRLGFALEPAQSLGIAGDIVRKELERDETMKAGVLRLVDDTHAAATQLFDNPVVGDGLANHGAGIGLSSYEGVGGKSIRVFGE